MTAIEGLIEQYGLWLVLFGSYFDHYGIPLYLLAGAIAASNGLLSFPGVLLAGFLGGWIADLFLYFLGHKTGLEYWMRFAWVQKLKGPIDATSRLIRDHPATSVILGRFLFAVSKLIPPFAGMIHFPSRRYILFSFLGNALYSLAYTSLGYFTGPWILKSLTGLKISSVATSLFIIALVYISYRKFMKSK